MSLASGGSSLHVATDWTAFGLFFLALITSFGGFTGWVLKRLDRNRKDWKDFVENAINLAMAEMKAQVATLAVAVADNSTQIRAQGLAVARMEGLLSGRNATTKEQM